MSFIAELKRRNVFKVAAAYVVVSWLVMQITDTVGDLMGTPDMVGKVIVLLLMAGFPVALFLAWAYELTPEGVKKADEVDKSESIAPVTGQKINTLIFVLMAVALGYFIWESRFASEESTTEPLASVEAEKAEPETPKESGINNASIAVLPFADLSQAKDQEYFTDGISEELLNLLAGVQNLKVTSRTSAFSFKGKDVSIREIASKLGVAHVLEGSVRKAGDTIRITAQLIRASDDAHLWSSTYDRKLENIFAIQDEIATAIVDALMPHLGMAAKPKVKTLQTTDPEAHRLFLLARHLMRNKRNETGLRQAREYLEQALALDDAYAPAHAAIAECWLLLGVYAEMTTTESLAKARPHIDRALELDPQLAAAYAVEGGYYTRKSALSRAMQNFNKALELNPSYSEVKLWKSNGYNEQLRYREAFALRKEVVAQDPAFALGLQLLGQSLIRFAKFREVEPLIQSLSELSPGSAEDLESYRLWAIGQGHKSLEHDLNGFMYNQTSPGIRNNLTWMLASLGLWAEAENISRGYFRAELTNLVLRSEFKEARALIASQAMDDPDDVNLLRQVANVYSHDGDYEKACRLYRNNWNERPEQEEWLRFGTVDLVFFSVCSRQTGQAEFSEQLLAYADKRLARQKEEGLLYWEYWVDEYAILLMKGEQAKALDIWQQAISEGFWNPYMKMGTWVLSAELVDSPRFESLWQQQTERMHAHGREFLQKVCKENPWKDAWQPAEGSCEKTREGI